MVVASGADAVAVVAATVAVATVVAMAATAVSHSCVYFMSSPRHIARQQCALEGCGVWAMHP